MFILSLSCMYKVLFRAVLYKITDVYLINMHV